MNFSDYFDPVNSSVFEETTGDYSPPLLASSSIFSTSSKFPSVEESSIVIIGIDEYRGSKRKKKSSVHPADAIREKLYSLKRHSVAVPVFDLGNFKSGDSLADTYAGIAELTAEFLPKNIVTIILGGSQDLTYAQYLGYKKLEQIINITGIDSHFDLGQPEDDVNSQTYLGKIIMDQPSYMFNYSHLAYQTYFTGVEAIELMKKLHFDMYRLGAVQEDHTLTEPVLRNADLITFDMSSIRSSDAPAVLRASPNGLYGEEACQMMLYAGMSDKLSGLGIYEYDAGKDSPGQTAHLIAQMLWYFIEGYSNRKKENPLLNKKGYVKYRVAVAGVDSEIQFLKSKTSDLWWMEVPVPQHKSRFLKQHLIPCSYRDYQIACSNEMPERWWQAFQKLM